MTATNVLLFPFFVIFVLLLALLLAMVVMPVLIENVPVLAEAMPADTSHAFLKHGQDAIFARECMSNPNSYLFYSPDRDRYARVCLTSNGKWGIYIYQSGDLSHEITAFIKNRAKNLQQVFEYLKRSGYILMN